MVVVFKHLNSNLLELHTSLKSNTKKNEILSSPFGNRIFKKNQGWGILWRIFFFIWDLFFGPDFRIKKLQKSVLITQKTFLSKFEHAKKSLDKFQKCLIQKLEDDRSFSSKEYNLHKWTLAEWSDLSGYFIKGANFSYKNNLENMLTRLSIPKNSLEHVSSKKTSKMFSNAKKIINLERELQIKTPLVLLRKLSQNSRIRKAEEKKLKEWITFINIHKNRISIRSFHKGLKALVSHISKYHCTQHVMQPGIARLEYELAKRHLTIFEERSYKHMEWRKTLKKGLEISLNGKKMILDEELVSEKTNSNNLIFSIQEDPSKIIVIGINEAILGMKASIAECVSWGIRPAKWHEVDRSGKYALVERLSIPILSHIWTSTKALTAEDQQQMMPIVNQIKWFIEQNKTADLEASHLMFDREGVLKTTKIYLEQDFNFPKIITFIKKYSKNNPLIYKEILKHTALDKHRYLSFYDEIAEKTLNEEEIDVKDTAAFHRIICPHTINQGLKFQQKLITYLLKTMKQINKEYDVTDILELSDFLKRDLLRKYRSELSICFLWPSTKENNRQYVTHLLRLQRKSEMALT